MAKQSDHIENRFRQAAENISVPPNPQAWEKMEELIDKENRRRPVLFWWYLLLLCIVGAASVYTYQLMQKPAAISALQGSTATGTQARSSNMGSGKQGSETVGKKSSDPIDQSVSTVSEKTSSAAPGGGVEEPGINRETGKNDAPPVTSAPSDNKIARSEVVNNNTGTGKLPGTKLKTKPEDRPALPVSGPKKSGNRGLNLSGRNKSAGKLVVKNPDQKSSVKEPGIAKEDASNTVSNADSEKPHQQFQVRVNDTSAAELARMKQDAIQNRGNSAKDPTGQFAKSEAGDSSTKKDSTLLTPLKLKSADNKWRLGRGFNISVTGELDATSLHHISLHEFKTLLGFGLGYRFSNRLSVQTGVFIQRAVYFAGPKDYTVKAGTYLSMYKISKIDANCLFYEIPLNVRYDFLTGKGVRFYASGGFNSYIMKNESYRYHATGMTGYRMFDSTFTGNRNIFASTYFSAGMEKKITPSLSIQLEPYVKLPNSGVGEGKVKLFSAGLQMSVKFQPVRAKSNRK